MTEVTISCISIDGENFCNSLSDIRIHNNIFKSIKSLNFIYTSNKSAVINIDVDFVNFHKFQGKRIKLFYYNKTIGILNATKMIIVRIIRKSSTIVLECVGLNKLLNLKSANLFSLNCRANIGDKNCKLNLEKFTIEGKVESYLNSTQEIVDRKLNIASPDIFQNGKIKINNMFFIVLYVSDSKIKILNEINVPLNIGLKYKLIPGCSKTLECCTNNYDNAINFQGEPFVFQKFSSSVF